MTDELRTEVLQKLSQNDWRSDERRKYLERLGTLTCASKIRVNFANIPTANCAWKEGLGYHEINMRVSDINTSEIEKKFDIERDLIFTLMQEGFLYHELGHVLMSDYGAWEDAVNSFSSLKKQAMFKQFLNCTEDVVIEAWLRRKFNCGKILDFKNEVKFYGISDAKVGDEFKFYENSVQDDFTALLNLIESVGRFDGKFLDWVGEEPEPSDTWAREKAHEAFQKFEGPVREMVSKAVREPNATARYELIAGTFDQLYDEFSTEKPADEDKFSPENEMGGDQEMEQMQIPVPSPPEGEGDEDEEEEGEGDDSGNNQGEQDPQGGEGSSVEREARSVEELLDGRSPEEVKVVM